MCTSGQLPGYFWASSKDATGFLPTWKCEQLEKPLPGTGPTSWHTMWKITRLIEGIGF